MKHKVKYLQFYIGNVCNLACPNCASYNNFAFKNQFSWHNNKLAAEQWSTILDPYEIGIIGGEPFTNPDLDNWVKGLLELFQPIDFRITTNGTYLRRDIDKVLEYTKLGVNIEISSHSDKHYLEHNNFISQHYPYPVQEDDCVTYTNGDKGFIEIRNATEFFNISLKNIDNGVFYMHDSNPITAHSSCPVSDCHYIVEGNLYQCVVTATGPLFAEQFNVDTKSKDLLSRVKSISPFDSQDKIDNFLNNIETPCEQCALCPEKIKIEKFELPNKKIKI